MFTCLPGLIMLVVRQNGENNKTRLTFFKALKTLKTF